MKSINRLAIACILVAGIAPVPAWAQTDMSQTLARYHVIVERNPFGAVDEPVAAPPPQAWIGDFNLTAVVSATESGKLAAIIEERSTKVPRYCTEGETVKGDIVLEKIEVGDLKITVYLRKGTQTATLALEPATANLTAVAPMAPPGATPGGPQPPTTIRRPPVPIRR